MQEGFEISQILSAIDPSEKWQNITDHENFEIAKIGLLKWKSDCKDFYDELGDYRNGYTTGMPNETIQSIISLDEDGLNTFFEKYPRSEMKTGLCRLVDEQMQALKHIRIEDAIMEPSHFRNDSNEEIHIPHIRLKTTLSLNKPATHIMIFIIDGWNERHCLKRDKMWDFLVKASASHCFKGTFKDKQGDNIALSLNRYLNEVESIINKQSNFSGKVFQKNMGTDTWRFNP